MATTSMVMVQFYWSTFVDWAGGTLLRLRPARRRAFRGIAYVARPAASGFCRNLILLSCMDHSSAKEGVMTFLMLVLVIVGPSLIGLGISAWLKR
jgi:hypothetical protein